MPDPPLRVLAPIEPPLVASPPPEAEVTVPPAPAAATPPRTPARPTAEPKPQPTPPPVAATTPPPPVAVEPPRELRTTSPAIAATERNVRDMLTRASRDLGRVDYTRLSADGRAQYDQSKRFSAQAEQALKERNLIFAATLADKAATLAAELVQ